MATFEPPYANTVPSVLPTGTPGVDPVACRLFRHYGSRPRGRSVLRIAGTYATYDYPTQDQIDAATEVYLGGHVYTVSEAVATALEAAGYETT